MSYKKIDVEKVEKAPIIASLIEKNSPPPLMICMIPEQSYNCEMELLDLIRRG